ncbi:MAG: tyrosine-type recombinase/integrase [Acidobacteria bacterium]|nr:tyrosine-type recombinase/integrase [Acidobacteriota bacterium]
MSEHRKREAASATINRECALLRKGLNLGRMQTSPKVEQVPYIPKLREDNVRKGVLEYPEFMALRQALPKEIRPLVTFAFLTGCRRCEMLSRRWSQKDWANQIVRLGPGTIKNDGARVLPLAPEQYEIRAMQKAIRDASYPECPWVFLRRGKPIKELRGACESA